MAKTYENGKLKQGDATKVCRNCGVEQPVDQYQITLYGTLASWCRTCKNQAALLSWHKRKLRAKGV